MYKLLLTGIVLLSGCQQLQHGQMQPVKLIGSNKYFTTCAGAVEGWSDCYDKAHRTCANGYVTLSTVDNNKGTQRDLTFQCKK